MQAFLEAVRFLTQIPVPWLPAMSDDYETKIARSVGWFPAVGLLVGLIGLAAGCVAGLFWPGAPLVRALFVSIAFGVVTAGLHLDGLSDTFDATLSWRPRERMLEIMKDSRIGAMGALALIAVFLLKVTLLAAAGEQWWHAALLAPMLGRWADSFGIFFFPAAKEGGLGKTFHHTVRRSDFVVGTVFVWFVLIGLAAWPGPYAIHQALRGVVALLLVLVAAAYFCRAWVQQLGGLTGDTYGALNEIGEVVALAALSATPLAF
jgi:adenosylcobinamide-GDP ribazoletransferase